MALRILSGVVKLGYPNVTIGGSVTITFTPFGLTSTSPNVTLENLESIGPARNFVSNPCRVVGVRSWENLTSTAKPPSANIGDSVSTTSLEIVWVGTGDHIIPTEIPFMVIGDVGFSFFDLFQ